MSCPPPLESGDRILLGHGGGGRLTQQLFESVFLHAFGNPALDLRHDGAAVEVDGVSLAITTDSFVVRPLLFPGGNIGDLAVNGTVNDLAMCGAQPLYLTAGFVLEEGLPVETLRIVVGSMREAAERAGVTIIAGDTKVVDRGNADGIFITTAGIGRIESPSRIGPSSVIPGDAIVISGEVGAHGIAVLSVREGLEFESTIVSDTAPLWRPVEALLKAGVPLHCLRDLTRGGLSSALNEISQSRGLAIEIDEASVPVSEPVRGACEILGFDPLYVANEGCFVAFVPSEDAPSAVDVLRALPGISQAAIIGSVGKSAGRVVLRSRIGGSRVLDMLSGEQLPRIC